MGLVKDDEPYATQRKHKGRCQALHDVLPIDTVCHERHLGEMERINGGKNERAEEGRVKVWGRER